MPGRKPNGDKTRDKDTQRDNNGRHGNTGHGGGMGMWACGHGQWGAHGTRGGERTGPSGLT